MAIFIKTTIYLSFFIIFILDKVNLKFLDKKSKLFIQDGDIIATISTDNETEFREAIKILNIMGGIVYIDTPIISISSDVKIELSGPSAGGIIGLKQPNDEYPRIDFKKVRDNFDGKSISQGMITITGNHKFLKYLIVENSACYGINVSGKKNYLDHIITRYNNFPGISLYKAESTTLTHCYSYRNFGRFSYGQLGDGFAIDFGTSNNTIFSYCFAWDNSNDGWLSFTNGQTDYSESVSFLHCGSWNNGNINVFTGKYDYDNGKPLDKNLWSIQDLINSDENYEKNYNKKEFNIDNGKICGEDVKEWISKANGYIDGSGFEFGQKTISDIQNPKRIVDYTASFNNKDKGLTNKNNLKCRADFTNNASFNNKINYQISFNFEKWSNNWSWGNKIDDQKDLDLKKPSKINTSEKLFYSVSEQIIKIITSNKFNDDLNFDSAIKNLN